MAVSKYGVEIPEGRPWLKNVVYKVVQGEPPPPVPEILRERMLKAIEETLGCKIERKQPHAG